MWPAVATLVLFLCVTCNTVYNIFFHPLSRFPGPRLWSLSRFTSLFYLVRGDLHHKLRELHDQYGKVVRTAPDELSSVDGSAWQSITAGGNHNQGLPKNPVIFGAQEFDSVFDHVGPAHSRLRRLLTQTFSGPILREQEPLLAEAVNKFAEKLRGFAKVGATVNMLEWFNYLSFDITGEITFSETFNQLDDERYHPWVDLIINHIKYSALAIGLRYFPPLDRIMPLLAPKRLKDLRYRFLFLAREKVMRRLHRDPKTLKHRDTFSICYSNLPGDVTQEELIGTFTFLIIAGSETSGTVLTGILNYLLSNPRVFQRLKDEVRGACSAGEDLGLNQTAHLPYLNAVLKEGLRLCNPLATALSRVVPLGGAKISGYEIPAKTIVGVPPFAANLSAQNFEAAAEFIPERWLPSPGASLDDPAIYRPFGVGGHSCVGQALARGVMRMALSRIVHDFEIEAVSKPNWIEQKSYMLWEKEPLMVRMVPAQKASS